MRARDAFIILSTSEMDRYKEIADLAKSLSRVRLGRADLNFQRIYASCRDDHCGKGACFATSVQEAIITERSSSLKRTQQAALARVLWIGAVAVQD